MERELAAAGELAVEITWKGERVTGLELRWGVGRQPDVRSTAGRALQAALESYAAGQDVHWPELPLDMEALPPFRRRVLETLRSQVGHGRTLTYGQLAALAGNPAGARAVGQAMAHNPFPLIIPCHRVLAASGRLGGFSGEGPAMKAYLLELEGIGPTPAASATNVS